MSCKQGRHAEITVDAPRPLSHRSHPATNRSSHAFGVLECKSLSFLEKHQHHQNSMSQDTRVMELAERGAHLADPVRSPAGGCSLAVDGLMKQGIDGIGSPGHPCLKALQPSGLSDNMPHTARLVRDMRCIWYAARVWRCLPAGQNRSETKWVRHDDAI